MKALECREPLSEPLSEKVWEWSRLTGTTWNHEAPKPHRSVPQVYKPSGDTWKSLVDFLIFHTGGFRGQLCHTLTLYF